MKPPDQPKAAAPQLTIPGVRQVMLPVLEVDGQPFLIEAQQVPPLLHGAPPSLRLRVSLLAPVAGSEKELSGLRPETANGGVLAAGIDLARKLLEQVRRAAPPPAAKKAKRSRNVSAFDERSRRAS